jgi:hypothetical protein
MNLRICRYYYSLKVGLTLPLLTNTKGKMKNFSHFLVAILAISLLGSCSKDKVHLPDVNPIKSAKFTVVIKGAVPADNNITFMFVTTGTQLGQNTTFWKINSVTQPNESLVKLEEDAFANTTTYVVETTQAVPTIDVSINLSTINNAAFTMSYTAVINGKTVLDQQNVAVNGTTPYQHDYTY